MATIITRPDFVPKDIRREADFTDPELLIRFINHSPLKDRFYALLRQEKECIEWIGPQAPSGYGIFSAGGVVFASHRLAWILHWQEPIPEDLMICHTCDNPPCCYHEHLRIGNSLDNMQDMWAKGRAGMQTKDYKVGRISHLTESLVKEIRVSKDDTTALSIRLGFPYGVVYAARHGMSWKHIKDPPPQPRKFARDF